VAEYVPSVRMRRIARTLLNWRVSRELLGADVASQAGWSASKQSRLENATQPIQPHEVMSLALIYGIPEDERHAVFNATMTAQKQGWWEAVGKDALVDDMLGYVELESEATTVRTFKIDLVPGLLQSTEYSAAIGQAYLPRASADAVRQRVEARARRQERLTDENPIKVEAVVSEAAFRTLVGGPEVMSHQLGRLLELTKLPNIDLRVIPMAAGAYPAMGTPFSLLSFAGDYPDVGYIDLISKGVYMEEPDDVEPYKINFAGLQEVALTPRRTRALITELAGSLR
jgi:transcriptional regulator with XRE-family HTH domain